MTPERWQQIKAVFNSALERPDGERSSFLEEACAGDESLRHDVESLISSHEEQGPFIDAPAYEVAADLLVEKHSTIGSGQDLGSYQILSTLGRGGMGEIYLAQDKRLGRKVALKFLPSSFTKNADRLRRFKQEARAVSALNHPNILTIHETGEVDGRHFIATEYVDGQTLRERLKDGGLKVEQALEIAIQIASALAAAHEEGIIHRDIKPDNIMLRRDGLVKVLDFGLAKLTRDRSASEDATLAMVKTSTGIVMGTSTYMSPEQARGLNVDARTDVWSLGVVVYEMVAGRAPFNGPTNSDLIVQILEREPASLAELCPDSPPELQRILNQALRKNPDERYQTVKDLLVDLKNLRREPRFPAKSESIKRFGSGSKVQLRTSLLVALSLLVLALAVFGVLQYASRNRLSVTSKPLVAAKTLQLTIWSGLDDFPSISPDGNAVAYCSNHGGGFEIYVKALTPGAKESQLTSDGGQNFEPAWSPDGQQIAYYSKLRGGIWIVPARGGEAKQITEFGSYPAWSPDGKQIAFQSNPLVDLGAYARNALPPSTLWLVSAQGGEPHQLTQVGKPEGGHGAPAWSPDGKRMAFEVSDFVSTAIWTISVNGDDAKRLSPESGYGPVYAPDGQSIFYSRDSGVLQMHASPVTGEPSGEPVPVTGIGGQPSFVRRVSFSADGRKAAYSLVRRTESISSVSLQPKSATTVDPPATLVSNASERNAFPSFSPDGKRIAFTVCNASETGCNIWLINTDGSNQTQLTTADSKQLSPSWFPDMTQIAYVSNQTGHFSYWAINLETRREKMLLDLPDGIDYARLSPDGQQIVFNSKRGGRVINIWTAALAGGEPKQLTFDKEMMGFPAWSPDGKLIAFQAKRGDDTHVMVLPSEGGTPTQLTFAKGQSWIYGWSPDGDKILFAGFRDGLWNVWWVSRTTNKEQQLTDYKKRNSFVRYPSWSPKGNQIVYEYSETTGNIWLAELK